MGNSNQPRAEEEPLNPDDNSEEDQKLGVVMSTEQNDSVQDKYLTFTFDARTDCIITVYYRTYILVNSPSSPITLVPLNEQEEFRAYKFSAGFKQQFPPGIEELNELEVHSKQMKTYEDLKYYPLIIKIESTGENKMVQYTLASFEKGAVKVQRQILQIQNSVYSLEEFYGTESKKDDEEEGTKECVVCYTELANTIVLPCRHLCLCSKCAQIVRMQTSKCPICRTPVKTFINFKVEGLAETQISINP